jgi:hypothetical protein
MPKPSTLVHGLIRHRDRALNVPPQRFRCKLLEHFRTAEPVMQVYKSVDPASVSLRRRPQSSVTAARNRMRHIQLFQQGDFFLREPAQFLMVISSA